MKSLRLRLLFGTFFWIALSLLVAGFGLSKLFYQHVSSQLTHELGLHLDQLTARLEIDPQGELALTDLPTDPRFSKPFSGLYWQVSSLIDQQLADSPLGSRSLWDQKLALPIVQQPVQSLPQVQQSLLGETPLVALVRWVELEGWPVQIVVAANEELIQAPVAAFQQELWLSLAVLGLGLMLAALMQVWVGLAPLKELRLKLQQLRAGGIEQLTGNFPQEIMPLVEDFNSVLEQNATMVTRAQTQAGNLAHALKTPLTILSNAAYAEPNNPLSALLLNQVQAAREQVDYHLKHARAAASAQRSSHAQTSVKETIEGMLPVMAKLYEDRHLDFKLAAINPELYFRGEQKDLQEMLGNLLDNACKWANKTVQVAAYQEQDTLVICIEDDGCGVDEPLQTQIVQRGVRADEKVQGSGLGLAIVADLATLYRGDLKLSTSKLGGLQAELIFSL